MEELVKQSYDKFENKAITQTVCVGNTLYMEVNLHHYSSPKGDVDCIDVFYKYGGSDSRLIDGELILLINGSARHSIKPNYNVPPTWDDGYWYQDMFYMLPDGLLHEMANASNLEIKVTGGAANLVLEDNKYPTLLLLSKALYNAVYDSSAFNDEIEKARRNNQERKEKEQQIQKEWNELVEKCKDKSHASSIYLISVLDWNHPRDIKKKIEEYGTDKIYAKTFYDLLNFAIPLYEKLLTHMHEYNEKYHLYGRIVIDDTISEKDIREDLNFFIQSRDKFGIACEQREQAATRRNVTIGIIAAIVVVVLLVAL